MDHLATALKRGGVKDLLLFFPPNKRDTAHLDAHFRAAGLPQVADWVAKRQHVAVKEQVVSELREMAEREETPQSIVAFIQQTQTVGASPLPDTELIACVWQGLISSVDWSARPDQIESLALREVGKFAPVLEPFCQGPKTEVALINVVQVYCYEDTKLIKAFPQILKVLYNKDCISDQAIIYWHSKGAKPQGKQHFLKATEPLVKVRGDLLYIFFDY